MTVAAIENGVMLLAEARDAVAAFQDMIRRKAAADLDPWLNRDKVGLIAAFAIGITKDKAPSPRRSGRHGTTGKPKDKFASSSS